MFTAYLNTYLRDRKMKGSSSDLAEPVLMPRNLWLLENRMRTFTTPVDAPGGFLSRSGNAPVKSTVDTEQLPEQPDQDAEAPADRAPGDGVESSYPGTEPKLEWTGKFDNRDGLKTNAGLLARVKPLARELLRLANEGREPLDIRAVLFIGGITTEKRSTGSFDRSTSACVL
ncbi:hypothetical protein [Amycolatopsis sp. EV170708-02-1]|uniref:hypothetical protein n=1 Tax=Amycolatopsis sp. EV170708-02-1 TaxID=2919322 RepID=UPI001F0BB532|nr:hypothetical protein [Amycolatopsis sp. EV170708-02-1]UMP06970.1 hypothetical protein MJQ72_20100 [Amycolatopsis sp. EV170708-02-1]